MTPSNGNSFRLTTHLCGEFTGPRWIPRRKASDAGLWCFLWSAPEFKRLSKQSWGWWFDMPSCPLWRHRKANPQSHAYFIGYAVHGTLNIYYTRFAGRNPLPIQSWISSDSMQLIPQKNGFKNIFVLRNHHKIPAPHWRRFINWFSGFPIRLSVCKFYGLIDTT